ncbi:MAG: antitoxin VapB family protein [Nitrososphaerales archaeon]
MGKTITITREAYEALAREKRSNESFSDVVLRLTSRKAKLSDYFGIWDMTDAEYDKLTKDLRSVWGRWTGEVVENT